MQVINVLTPTMSLSLQVARYKQYCLQTLAKDEFKDSKRKILMIKEIKAFWATWCDKCETEVMEAFPCLKS